MEGLPWGGSEVLWSRAAAHLLRSGADVAAGVRRWPATPPPVAELGRAGCRLFFRDPPTLAARACRRLGLCRPRTYDWLGRFRPDLAVVSLGIHLEGVEAAAACRAAGVPYALVVQAADENRWPGDDDLDALREAYLGARACFFVSRRNRELLETMLAAPLPNARVVCNPFNVRYDAAPPWPDGGELRLACVGALAPVAKGQDLLFAALARPEWRERPVRVSLYGAGQNARSLRRLAELWRLDRVEFRGFADDIEAVWAGHHALVLPSRHEGMPLAVLEALLCGRVCVVTDVAGNTEYIDDGVTGFVAAGPTPALFRDALERAWARRDEWRQIGEQAARSARDRIPGDPAAAFVEELEKCVRGARC
jgi:glycosyltransferase involved in cell wall biosynthesis